MERQNYTLAGRDITPESVKAALVHNHPALEHAQIVRLANYLAGADNALAEAPPGYVFLLYRIPNAPRTGITVLPIGSLVEIHPEPQPAKSFAPDGVVVPTAAPVEPQP